MKPRCLLLALPVFVMLTACDDASTQARIEELSTDVKFLKYGQGLVRKQLNTEQVAVLDPTAQGFSFFECEAGRLLVSCQEMVQYLDGQKVVLSIGNPLNMGFTGFKLKVLYGTRGPEFPTSTDHDSHLEWQQANAAWRKTLREKEITFTEPLSPGSWNRIELILSPAKPEEVAYLELALQTNGVLLLQPK